MASPLLARSSSHGASAFGSVGATPSLSRRTRIVPLAVWAGSASCGIGASAVAALSSAAVAGAALVSLLDAAGETTAVGGNDVRLDGVELSLGAAGARVRSGTRYCAVTAPAVMASAMATAMGARRLVPLRFDSGSASRASPTCGAPSCSLVSPQRCCATRSAIVVARRIEAVGSAGAAASGATGAAKVSVATGIAGMVSEAARNALGQAQQIARSSHSSTERQAAAAACSARRRVAGSIWTFSQGSTASTVSGRISRLMACPPLRRQCAGVPLRRKGAR